MQITETQPQPQPQPQPKRIVINLDSEDRAKVFKAGERLQVSAYEAVCRSLKTSMEFAEQLATQLSEYGQPSDQTIKPIDRIHNAIFVDGERGTGKTAFMLNLEEAYRQTPGVARNSLFFCQPIDPTLLSIKEDFINVIIGQLHREVEHLLQHKSETMPEDYVESLEQVVDCLESGQTAKSSYGVDRLLAFKGSLELELRLYDYFAKTKKVLGCKAIVLPIDDVDMSLDVAFNVLEVIRKYLASPFVLPVVSGDKKLYQDIVSRHFIHKLAVNEKSPSNDEFDNSAALALKYLQKIFPEHYEVKLQLIPELSKSHQLMINYDGDTISLRALQAKLRQIVFAGATHAEKFWTDFSPSSARDLVQLTSFLNNLSPEIKSKLFVREKDATTPLATNIELLQALASYFNARGKEALVKSVLSTIELLNWQDENAGRPLLRDITLFDMHALKTKSDVNHFAHKCNEQLEQANVNAPDKALQRKYFDMLKPLLVNYPAVEPFSNTLLISKKRVNEVTDSQSKLLLALYTHHDYFSSYQSGYLIFFGKVFELVVTSLYRDLNAADVETLLHKAPLHSFFQYFATKTVTEEREDEVEDPDESTAAHIELYDKEYQGFADDINQWRASLGTLTINAHQLYCVFLKYMSNIMLLKSKDFIKEQPLLKLHQRIKFILLNAAASYEIGQDGLVNQGIALNKNFDAENTERYDNSYRKNIAPLLEQQGSITAAINAHPVFDLVLPESFNIKLSPRQFEQDIQEAIKHLREKLQSQAVSIESRELAHSTNNVEAISSNSRLARRALKKVISEDKRKRLESIDQYNFEKHVDFIANIVNLITSSDAMTEQRATYNSQKEDKRSLFGQIYHLASQGGMSDLLDKWLNE